MNDHHAAPCPPAVPHCPQVIAAAARVSDMGAEALLCIGLKAQSFVIGLKAQFSNTISNGEPHGHGLLLLAFLDISWHFLTFLDIS